MNNENNVLLEKVKEGFASLDIDKEHIDSAVVNINAWLSEKTFKDYAPQIEYLIESGKWEFLLDSFYQVIPFGTGGRRGLVGIGPNRINTWTIQSSAQGHSQYLIKQYGEEAKKRGVVIAFDVREYTEKGVYDDSRPNPVMNLTCLQLAQAAARVYTANGLKVYLFDDPRSTPELSFAIRYLGTVSGDMISASHNPPTDNGKKIYDEFGGQLIPPDDEKLVEEVTDNVTEIKTISLDEAKEKGLIEIIGKEVDDAYHAVVTPLSLSEERDIKILYSPLHGTGLTSAHPVLKQLGFDVTLDPETSYFSGAFENITFNIANPEVIQSFDGMRRHADKIGSDILINTDPDADRIGVMVRRGDGWAFLNGNEIGVILTNYAITKFKSRGLLNKDCVLIKTDMTTSLIASLAEKNDVTCIGDLLVGFKYIADVMNSLEKENRMDGFLMGCEESHGYIMGNYCRDKDAAGAAIWLAELAAELKKENKDLLGYLDEIYAMYGYCHNYLTEIRLLGVMGKALILKIMDYLRKSDIRSFGDFTVNEKRDRWDGDPKPHLSDTDTSSRNVLVFYMNNPSETQSVKVTVRPSGTEPKIKMYFEIFGKPFPLEQIDAEKEKISGIRESLEKAFMTYCYKIIDVDFPDRGFLLFWQLPLDDKLKYFEIESGIAGLIEVEDKGARRAGLDKKLAFLGADPVEKVDDAFRAKYGAGVLDYLEL